MATIKKRLIEERKIEKGLEGEKIVQNALKQALDILKIRYKLYSNVYLQFPSSYGGKYGFTTEIDHVVITEQFIFVVETKNQTYYDNSSTENLYHNYWHLNDDKLTKVLNPMIQNYYHKILLSEQLGVDREAILQLVCLKDIPPDGGVIGMKDYRSINNHFLMFNDDDFIDNLCKIFMTENEYHTYDFEKVLGKMNRIVNRQYLYKEYHIENLKRVKYLLKYQFGTKRKLGITDIIICPKCGSIMSLFLNDMPRYKGQKRRGHKFYPITKCSNEECGYRCDFDRKGIEIEYAPSFGVGSRKKIVNADIKVKTIEERLGYDMAEDYQQTVLDKIEYLESAIEKQKRISGHFESLFDEKNKNVYELKEELGELRLKNNQINSELQKFKRLIGSIYIKKKQ